MKKAAQLSLDATFIYMDETEGWKISHYIPESHELDYANKEEVAAAKPAHKHAAHKNDAAQINNVAAGTSLGDLDVLADLKAKMEKGE